MPKYEVNGADGGTAESRNLTIEAADESEAAAIANHRGVMVHDVKPAKPDRGAQTVELTSKRWKTWQLAGLLTMLLGTLLIVVMFAVAAGAGLVTSNAALSVWFAFMGLALFTGMVLYLVGRIGAWWYHG